MSTPPFSVTCATIPLWRAARAVWLSFALSCTAALGAEGLRASRTDIPCGSHERQELDFYAVRSDRPTPLAIHSYVGGFVNGDKSRLSAQDRDTLLAASISVAAINYRHANKVPLPAAFHDGARAVQYLRSRAVEWNIDKSRVPSPNWPVVLYPTRHSVPSSVRHRECEPPAAAALTRASAQR